MAGAGVTVADLRTCAAVGQRRLCRSANWCSGNRTVAVEAGPFLNDARDVGELVVGVHDGRAGFPARRRRRARRPADRPRSYVWHGIAGARQARGEFPAVTHQRSPKSPARTPIDVADAVDAARRAC